MLPRGGQGAGPACPQVHQALRAPEARVCLLGRSQFDRKFMVACSVAQTLRRSHLLVAYVLRGNFSKLDSPKQLAWGAG